VLALIVFPVWLHGATVAQDAIRQATSQIARSFGAGRRCCARHEAVEAGAPLLKIRSVPSAGLDKAKRNSTCPTTVETARAHLETQSELAEVESQPITCKTGERPASACRDRRSVGYQARGGAEFVNGARDASASSKAPDAASGGSRQPKSRDATRSSARNGAEPTAPRSISRARRSPRRCGTAVNVKLHRATRSGP